MTDPNDVLSFWFAPGHEGDEKSHLDRIAWWFRGGADAEIIERFGPLTEAALAGELDAWAETPRGRLALIVALDQFPRSLFRNTAKVYAGDSKALALALDGMERGFFDQLPAVWEKMFFVLPLGHSEQLPHLERSVELSEALIDQAPPHLRRVYEFSASQARGHRDVVRRFGRQPHRNALLGRESTPEELEYLAEASFVHQRALPKP